MLLNEYIVIDTETTGCRPTHDRITEVGLCHIINGKIVRRWQRLVNPGVLIPIQIQQLTGITNELVADAPYFENIAVELKNILNNKIFVAHNARFDYGFLKNEFLRCGINLQLKTLCTVKLSRLLFPEYKSHSLDAIKSRFNLNCKDRHRALGDAQLLFNFISCIEPDKLNNAARLLLKKPSLPSHLPLNILENIPNTAGVYKFYGEDNALLYIGKSVNLKQRILSHFGQDYAHNKEMRLSQQIKSIDYIPTAGELGALLLESKLIKQELPIFNHKLRKYKNLFAIKLNYNKNNYAELDIANFENQDLDNIYGLFRKKRSAEEALRELVKAHQLCPKLAHLEKSRSSCFYYQIKRCKGACCEKESAEIYNIRVNLALSGLAYKKWPYEGKIAIQEYCKKQDRVEYHIFDQWCYLDTVKSESDLWDQKYNTSQLDIDIYNILNQFLSKKKSGIKIIPL